MKKFLFDKLSNGKEVYSYSISWGDIELVVLDYGATIQSIKFKGKDCVLGFDNINDYEESDAYFGATIGRVANRIKGGKFKIGKKTYKLNKNDGNNTLHGGRYGFNTVVWEVESVGPREIVFKYFSHDKDEGFPGNLLVKVRYYIRGNRVGIEYTAVSDQDTVVNLTNHTYFNLIGDESAENMFLAIKADYYTPIDKNLIPTGKVLPVKDTPMDFNWAKFIGKDIGAKFDQLNYADGYDHNYVLKGAGFRKFAVLSSARSDILMTCYTDQPGVQLYTGNKLNGIVGKGSVSYGKRWGVCLETQTFPNAVNEKRFEAPILKEGETYRTKTEFAFDEFMSKSNKNSDVIV